MSLSFSYIFISERIVNTSLILLLSIHSTIAISPLQTLENSPIIRSMNCTISNIEFNKILVPSDEIICVSTHPHLFTHKYVRTQYEYPKKASRKKQLHVGVYPMRYSRLHYTSTHLYDELGGGGGGGGVMKREESS